MVFEKIMIFMFLGAFLKFEKKRSQKLLLLEQKQGQFCYLH